MAAAPALLPPDLLDRTILRHWHRGTRRDLTGREVWGQAARLGAWLDGATPPGAFVLLVGHTSPEAMAAFLGIAASGRVGAWFPPQAAIQDARHYDAQQREAFAAIAPDAVVATDAAVAEGVRRLAPGLSVLVIPQGPPGEAAGALDAFRARLHADAPLFVQHSSGTTGIKKAVAITGRMLRGQFEAYWPVVRAEIGAERLRIATWLPLYHDMGLVASFLLPMLGGDCVSVVDPFEWIADPGAFLRMIEADGCDVAWMPNFAFRHFVRLRRGLKPHRLETVRLWVDCSEPCRWADARDFEAEFAEWGVRPRSVVGCYAMAETVFAVSQCSAAERRALVVPRSVVEGASVRGALVMEDGPAALRATPSPLPFPPSGGEGEGRRAVLSSGRVLPGLDVATYHGGRRLPEGTYGEIGIAGGFTFDGYRNRTATASGIEGGVFRTGDLGVILDGHLYVSGRLKEIVIVNGKNIFAGDVEAALGALPGLRRGRVVAFGLESAQTGSEELVIVAERDETASAPAGELRAAVTRLVSEAFLVRPRDVRIVEERWLVKSTSGKISRDENRRRYLERFRG